MYIGKPYLQEEKVDGLSGKKIMYRVKFSDGGESILYNKTRAKEFLRRLNEGEDEKDIRIGFDI